MRQFISTTFKSLRARKIRTMVPYENSSGHIVSRHLVIEADMDDQVGRVNLTAWTDMADLCQIKLKIGRKFGCITIPHFYQGVVRDKRRIIFEESGYKPLLISKMGFTITKLIKPQRKERFDCQYEPIKKAVINTLLAFNRPIGEMEFHRLTRHSRTTLRKHLKRMLSEGCIKRDGLKLALS